LAATISCALQEEKPKRADQGNMMRKDDQKPMRRIEATEAMVDLDRLLDDVESGESIQIARDGKIVARILPIDAEQIE
jgi:ribosome assembly protein YihI (activator of Der GTPase)